MSRRQLVGALGAMVAVLGGAGRAAAQDRTQASTFEGVGLNHIALNVTDIPRSRDFYVRHLGLKVTRESQSNCFMDCGDHFVALFRAEKPGMNHYCYAIRDFDVEAAADKLRSLEITPRVTQGRIYFPDPDGIEVQLSSATHRSGDR